MKRLQGKVAVVTGASKGIGAEIAEQMAAEGADPAAKARDLQLVLARASARDAMTLWHLIARVSPGDRAAVIAALDARVPMPAGVTRDAVMRLDKAALDQWWDALGLRDASWWRKWKGPYPADVK